MRLIFLLILIQTLNIFKYVHNESKCPFSNCKTIYILNGNYCNIYCISNLLIKSYNYETKIIDVFQITGLKSFTDDLFKDFDINILTMKECSFKNMSAYTFRGLIKIERLYLIKIDSLDDFFSEFQLSFLQSKIMSLYIKESIEFNSLKLTHLFGYVNKLEIKNFFLENIDLKTVELDLMNLNNFNFIYLTLCSIDEFKIKLSKNLSELVLSNNKLSEVFIIPTDYETDLMKIDMSKNFIKEIRLHYLTNLEILNLDENKFKILKNNYFIALTNLKYFYSTRNEIKSIESNCFKSLINLIYLDLSKNFLDESLELNSLNKLEILYLKENQFKSFNNSFNINAANSLTVLDLSSNMIENLIINSTKILDLNLANNRISSFDNLNMENLIKLDISYNLIENLNILDSKMAKSIQVLDLSGNKIKFIDSDQFRILENLINLNLEKNLIKNFECNYKNRLQILNLSFNKLTKIEAKTFENLISISILQLTNNMIYSIDESSFDSNQNLTHLRLNDNFLSTTPNLKYLSNLILLDLSSQNKKLTQLPNYFLDRIMNSEINILNVNIDANLIEKFSPHVFCSKYSSKIYFSNLYIKNINSINKCILKQLNSENLIQTGYTNTDCQIKLMSQKYKIQVMTSNKYDSVCKNYTLLDDCSNESNLKYNCSFDLDLFLRFTTWYLPYSYLFSIEKYEQICKFESYEICFKTEFFAIYCVSNLILGLTKIDLFLNHSLVYNLTTDLRLNRTDTFYDHFESIQFETESKILYHKRSYTYIFITKTDLSYSLVIRATKYIYSKSNGLLVNGCLNESIKFDRFNYHNDSFCNESLSKSFNFRNVFNISTTYESCLIDRFYYYINNNSVSQNSNKFYEKLLSVFEIINLIEKYDFKLTNEQDIFYYFLSKLKSNSNSLKLKKKILIYYTIYALFYVV